MKPSFSKLLIIFLFMVTLIHGQPGTGNKIFPAFTSQKTMLQKSPYKNLQWRLIGPDNRSGRSTDVAGIPGNPAVMYAAFATGGLWKTTDTGNTWHPIFDKEATLSIGAISLARSNPEVVYVGTGEANIFRASLRGTGIYKSTDGGRSFQTLGLENTGTIARIVVHPRDPQKVYVAAGGNEWSYNKERGVYFTADGGKTWKKILYVNEKTGCIDLVMDPSDPKILYASMWNRIRRRWSDPMPEDGDYIYKTTDGGKTWKIINKGLPDTKYTGRIGLAVSHSNPNIVYAFIDDHTKKREPRPGETDSYERQVQKVVVGAVIYRSSNKGESWERMGEVHDFLRPFSGTYGWVFGQIRVHPQNQDRVYALGVSKAISEDGGKTWKIWNPTDTTGDWTHGDNHALWFDEQNPDRILIGNDGGVILTNNGGKKWKNFFSKIPTTQFYTITYDMDTPFRVYGAVQDEGTMSGNVLHSFGVTDGPSNQWRMVPGGEGTQVQVDPQNSNIIFSSSYYGRLMKSDLSQPESLGTARIKMFAVGAIDSLRGEWMAPTLISKFDHRKIYHGLQYLYKSDDEGTVWTRISNDLSYNDKSRMGIYPYLIYHQVLTSIAEGSRPGVLFAGTDDGRIWLTRDDGNNWKEITRGLPVNKHIAKITSSKFREGRIYVVVNDRRQDNPEPYIFQSDDFGANWKLISGNLPKSPVNVIIEDPDKENQLYCGTDMGVYLSKNGGKTWVSLNGNLPASVAVDDMFIHPRDKKFVIATYGRGVWVLDDLSLLKK